nr:hypothetical protein [Sediminibacterium sp.]
CYALGKPLLLVNTLQVIAQALLMHLAEKGQTPEQDSCLCPMIDARRMEVFTACLDRDLHFIQEAGAHILDETFYHWLPPGKKIFFCGNGATKLEALHKFPADHFFSAPHRVTHLAILADTAFQQGQFADLAYAEPYYCKAFYSPPAKKSQKT